MISHSPAAIATGEHPTPLGSADPRAPSACADPRRTVALVNHEPGQPTTAARRLVLSSKRVPRGLRDHADGPVAVAISNAAGTNLFGMITFARSVVVGRLDLLCRGSRREQTTCDDRQWRGNDRDDVLDVLEVRHSETLAVRSDVHPGNARQPGRGNRSGPGLHVVRSASSTQTHTRGARQARGRPPPGVDALLLLVEVLADPAVDRRLHALRHRRSRAAAS